MCSLRTARPRLSIWFLPSTASQQVLRTNTADSSLECTEYNGCWNSQFTTLLAAGTDTSSTCLKKVAWSQCWTCLSVQQNEQDNYANLSEVHCLRNVMTESQTFYSFCTLRRQPSNSPHRMSSRFAFEAIGMLPPPQAEDISVLFHDSSLHISFHHENQKELHGRILISTNSANRYVPAIIFAMAHCSHHIGGVIGGRTLQVNVTSGELWKAVNDGNRFFLASPLCNGTFWLLLISSLVLQF